jgi:hypothetical protein
MSYGLRMSTGLKKIQIITFICLIGIIGLFSAIFCKVHAADPVKQERPLIEDPTGEGDDSNDNSEEPDFDEKDLDELDPWFFDENGKDADPAKKDVKDHPRQKELKPVIEDKPRE